MATEGEQRVGSKHLSNRDNWQLGANVVGSRGEVRFVKALAKHLPTHYTVQLKPPKLKVYLGGRGIVLDARVTNTRTGESIYIEKKTGNNGGNAHERVYKYLSPALKKKVSREHATPENPFFLVFSGETFQGDKYKNELELLLEGAEYTIMQPGYSNIREVADRIMEII